MRTAAMLEDYAGAPFDYTYEQALAAWQDPPVRVVEHTSQAIKPEANSKQCHDPHFARDNAAVRHRRAVGLGLADCDRAQEPLSAAHAHHLDQPGANPGRPLPGDLHPDPVPVCHPDRLWPVVAPGELPARSGCDPAGGYQRCGLHRRPGAADRGAGAQRGAGDHLLAGADVPAGRSGRRLGAAGGGWTDLRGHRPFFTGGLGNGRL